MTNQNNEAAMFAEGLALPVERPDMAQESSRLPSWLVKSCAGVVACVACMGASYRSPAPAEFDVASVGILAISDGDEGLRKSNLDSVFAAVPSIAGSETADGELPDNADQSDLIALGSVSATNVTEIVIVDDTRRNMKPIVSDFKQRIAEITGGQTRVKTRIVAISKKAKKALTKLTGPKKCIAPPTSSNDLGAYTVLDKMPKLNEDPNNIITLATDIVSCPEYLGVTSEVDTKNGRQGIIDLYIKTPLRNKFGKYFLRKSKRDKALAQTYAHEVAHRYGLGHSGSLSKELGDVAINLSNYDINNLPIDPTNNKTIINLNEIGIYYKAYGRQDDLMGYVADPYRGKINTVQADFLADIGKAKSEVATRLPIGTEPISITASNPALKAEFGSLELGYTTHFVSNDKSNEVLTANRMDIVPVFVKNQDGSWGTNGIEVFITDPRTRTVATIGKLGQKENLSIEYGKMYSFTLCFNGVDLLVQMSRTGVSLQNITAPPDPTQSYDPNISMK